LDVLQDVFETVAVRFEQGRVLRQAVKHEGVVGVGAVAELEQHSRSVRATPFSIDGLEVLKDQ